VALGPPGTTADGERGKRERDEGVLLPSSPWAGVRCRGGSVGGGRLQVGAARVAARWSARREGKMACGGAR
jgi:hypothetical protein